MESAVPFDDVHVEIYQLLMQSYTSDIGEKLTDPLIITTCNVTEQEVAGGNPDGGGGRGRDRRRTNNNSGGGWWRRNRRRTIASGSWSSLFGWRTNDGERYEDAYVDDDDGGVRVGRGTKTNARSPDRDLEEDVTMRNLIVMSFTMTYETRYGIEISEYPYLFSNHIASNLDNVTNDMQLRFLPVVSAMEVIVYNPDPTIAPSPTPPSTTRPSTSRPHTPSEGLISDKPSFVVGLAAGLTFAFVVVLFAIGYAYLQRRGGRDKEGTGGGGGGGVSRVVVDMGGPSWEEGEGDGIEVVDDEYNVAAGDTRRMMSSDDDDEIRAIADGSKNDWVRHRISDDVDDVQFSSPLSNPSMVSEGGGSFSSNGDDGGVRVDALQDEFDQYKNEDLEHMRNGVEGSVYGAEGMMSLAMTRALMDDEDADVHPSWGEAEDPESIEANALCETNDWLRKNELTTLEERFVFSTITPPPPVTPAHLRALTSS